jgi:ABC-type sugar transport system substrate-binding protein
MIRFTKVRTLVLAAALVVASLSAAAPASAMRNTCTEGRELFYTYLQLGDYWGSRGYAALSTYYYNLAKDAAANTYCP